MKDKNRKRRESTRCHEPSFRAYFRAKYSGEASLNKRETEKRFFFFSVLPAAQQTLYVCVRIASECNRTRNEPFLLHIPEEEARRRDFSSIITNLPCPCNYFFSSAPSLCLLSSAVIDLDLRGGDFSFLVLNSTVSKVVGNFSNIFGEKYGNGETLSFKIGECERREIFFELCRMCETVILGKIRKELTNLREFFWNNITRKWMDDIIPLNWQM